MAFGFCASKNLDAVLLKLEQITKNDMVPKSSGFLGLIKVSHVNLRVDCLIPLGLCSITKKEDLYLHAVGVSYIIFGSVFLVL